MFIVFYCGVITTYLSAGEMENSQAGVNQSQSEPQLVLPFLPQGKNNTPISSAGQQNAGIYPAGSGAPDTPPMTLKPVPIGPKRILKHKTSAEALLEPKVKGKGFCSVTLMNANGPRAARVELFDAKGSPVDICGGRNWMWADGYFSVPLEEGTYTFVAASGPRIRKRKGVLEIRPNMTATGNIVLEQFMPARRLGWIMLDPFVDIRENNTPDSAKLYGILPQAFVGIRAEGLEAAGISSAESVRDIFHTPYEIMPDKGNRLTKAFNKAQKSGLLTVFSGKLSSSGEGGAYYLNPKWQKPSDEKNVQHFTFEHIASARDNGSIVVLNTPCGHWGRNANPDYVFNLLAGPGYDAIDIGEGTDAENFWIMLLDKGYRISAISGGPDAPGDEAIAGVGAYVRLSEGKGASDMLASIRKGEVTSSNGPFLSLTVSGAHTGISLPAARGGRKVEIMAASTFPFEDSIKSIDLIYNGKLMDTFSGMRLQKNMAITTVREFTDGGYIIARYVSRDPNMRAITNPVYITEEGIPRPKPVPATIKIMVRNSNTNKAICGTMKAFNYGNPIGTYEILPKGTSVTLPATAEIELTAPGRESVQLSIYRDCGVQGLLKKMSKDSSDPYPKWNVFEKLSRFLAGIEITVNLDQRTEK